MRQPVLVGLVGLSGCSTAGLSGCSTSDLFQVESECQLGGIEYCQCSGGGPNSAM
jgi:hypothetical protein